MTDLDPRRALQVTRYHTWPRLREQTVGEHSAQVARILLAIWPDAPRHVLVHCITHDMGEVGPGDPPYPSKTRSEDFARGHGELEAAAYLEMRVPWGLPPPSWLQPHEKAVFKLAEFLEMWEWASAEVLMGNQAAGLVEARCRQAADRLMEHVPGDVHQWAAAYIRQREQHNRRVQLGQA